MKRGAKIAFSAIVIGLCGAVLLLSFILPKGELRGNETAVPKPKLIVGGKVNFEVLNETEAYYSKNFALRNYMITAMSSINGALMSPSSDVIVGKDGWLFYGSTVDDYMGQPSVTQNTAERIAVTLSLVDEYAETLGADFLFVPAPNKNTVYPDMMPYYYIKGETGGTVDLLKAAMDREGTPYLYLADHFRESDRQLYHKLDSHWNNLGASAAEYEIMRALGREGTDYSRRDHTESDDFKGDLYEMLYPEGKKLDTQYYYSMPELSESGTSVDITYNTECETAEGTLLMFRDSFGNALAPFMAAEFRYGYFSRSVPYDMRAISEYKADCVIIEIAQRNIASLAENAPIMPAPLRDIEMPEKNTAADMSVEVTEYDGMTRVTGRYDGAFERAYIAVGDKVYEAFPLKDGFEAYLDGVVQNSMISVILNVDGELTVAYN